jgi:signal transduction histidine kinase/CheY-like chemotaxis protein
MNYLLFLWNKIRNNGTKANTPFVELKNIVFTNTLLIIATSSYLIFASTIFFLKVFSTKIFLISTSSLLLGFLLVFVLIKYYRILLAKNILLLLIFFGVFFYDYYVGKWAGVYLYYFAFFFVAINIFSWRKEKFWLMLHLLLPIALIVFSELHILHTAEVMYENNSTTSTIYIFNFCMAFLIIAVNAFFIIKENFIFQQTLELSKLNIQALIDNTQGYIWSIDNDYKIIAFNKSYKDIIRKNYGVDCYNGCDSKLILALPNNPKEINGIYERVLNGESFTAEYFSNNDYFEVQASPLYNTNHLQNGATFHSRIVTERKIAEQNLQQAKINLETLVDSVGNSTWSLTKDYKIIAASQLYINDMKRIFGVDIIPGYDLSILFALDDYPQEWREQYNTVFSGQNLFLDYIFDDEYFELNAVPIRNVNKEVVAAVFFSRNITYRKNTEKELNEARIKAEEAIVEKAQFLSNMSHELRTPLNGIIGLTNILISEEMLPSQTNHLEVLKYSSDHMLVLINDILDFNKIEAGKVVLENDGFNLLETIEKMKSFFSWEASSKGLHFEVNANNILNRTVKGDVTRIRQVITNLISNAIKFTEKGFVIFSVEILEQLSEKQCTLRFSISDSGIGIENDKLEKIFESFGQADQTTIRKYGGSGLGLTISKRLITLMGSELKVESTPEKGSKFWFDLVLDCSVTEQILPVQKNINDMVAFKKLAVLVAEDNPINMLVVCKMLEKWNVVVHKAKDGSEAVELVGKNKFDLILMDLQMPVMDGLTATKFIREKNNSIPIIALTATTDESLTQNLHEKGINDIVQKPFVPEDLYNKIKTLVAHIE